MKNDFLNGDLEKGEMILLCLSFLAKSKVEKMRNQRFAAIISSNSIWKARLY